MSAEPKEIGSSSLFFFCFFFPPSLLVSQAKPQKNHQPSGPTHDQAKAWLSFPLPSSFICRDTEPNKTSHGPWVVIGDQTCVWSVMDHVLSYLDLGPVGLVCTLVLHVVHTWAHARITALRARVPSKLEPSVHACEPLLSFILHAIVFLYTFLVLI